MVKTNVDTNQISDRLKKCIDSNDKLLIIEVNPATAAEHMPDVWKWIFSCFENYRETRDLS
ncbi:hypothetical protein BZZ01_11715 [Nostocales cyanobacterium HT-58-2]|nr:hypothetical protein BZZ01_11715 [Nostocales cyanobacterium HT-58-2]